MELGQSNHGVAETKHYRLKVPVNCFTAPLREEKKRMDKERRSFKFAFGFSLL